MSDQIEVYGESMIQHGKNNDRAYLMKVSLKDCPEVVDYAVKLAAANEYSKIFAKAQLNVCKPFLEQEFVAEAKVPGLFDGREDGFFLSKFIHPDRCTESEPDTVDKVLAAALNKAVKVRPVSELKAGFKWRIMQKQDVADMAQLYKRVFESYPFPIHDLNYIARTMDENIIYHGIFKDDLLVALSSAEIDFAARNVEMTDFATDPDYRGHGLATYLLDRMEDDVRASGIQTAYTIARAYSYGMNITFAKHGYHFAGTLTNNTQISGQLESMNVWYKAL